MKKKVFSLMMTCVLAFMGLAHAQVLTVYDGTATNSYVPVYGLYADAYLKCEYVMPAADLAEMAGANINSVTYFLSTPATASWSPANFQVFMKEVSSTTISAFEGMSGATLVYEGPLDGTQSEMGITFSTPFYYTGGNLLVGIYNTVIGSWKSASFKGVSAEGACVQGYSYSSLEAVQPTQRNFLPKARFTYSGGAGQPGLHVAYVDGTETIVDELNLGYRPIDAWMEPFQFTMYNNGPAVTISLLDFTPNDGLFELIDAELPITIGEEVELSIDANVEEAGLIERQFVAIYEGRQAQVWPITVNAYVPECPDVVEVAQVVTSYPYVNTPTTMTELQNNYTLPCPEIPEGKDAVYKLTFEEETMLSASVVSGENGKVALYTSDFFGQPGPMADNFYTGPWDAPTSGGGSTGSSFEAMIGDETSTSTSGYFPFYTLYNYSISQNLFLASELTQAGVTTAPMGSLSWYATNSTGYAQQGISIWMANVSDTQVNAASPLASNMILVYTGSMTPEIGWNEFVFNAGSFAWDGTSNILILCQRNNGAWNSTVNWRTHNPGFQAQAHLYTDSAPYDVMNSSYSMTATSTSRANIIMKSATRRNTHGCQVAAANGQTGMNADNVGMTNRDGWYYYDNGTCASAIGAGGSFYWGVMFPAGTYTGNTVSKVALYDYAEMLGTVTIYNDGAIAPANAVGSRSVTLTGSDSFVEFSFAEPVAIDPTKNVWVVVYNANSTSYPAAVSANTGDANGRWISLDGEEWDDLVGYGLDYTWMVRAFFETNDTPGPNPGVTFNGVIDGMTLVAGTYYLVASATSDEFTVEINAETLPCPVLASEPTPEDGAYEIQPASVTLRWMLGDYTTQYRLRFGSTYFCEETLVDWTSDLAWSYTITDLYNNNQYFWCVDERNGECETMGQIWGFTTHLNVPQNLTVVDETVFDDEEIVLNWTAVVDRTYRQYNIYRDGELVGNTIVNDITNSTYSDGPLPYNADGYTYYVTALYDEGESAPSNTVNVKVSGRGNVNGYVYEQDGETGIAGAVVTYQGLDEFNVSHTYNFTTNANGFYSGAMYAGTYNGSASCDGYQSITEPVQGNPVVIVNEETTSPIDYMLNENYDIPCSVIAEYYPDSLDPESPYVKVYWGCGLPGEEIIEPFETGDFSLFDWQIDPTYPWSITTTNPYEGQYCMKSGGAGIANVVSNMSVTVNIPADGKMSFFGKISSENNWDYGYFYIDGVQKASFTGAGNWVEKEYEITAGDHTFKWSYTKDGSVNSNDDCFYVDYITFYKRPEPALPGTVYDFENSSMQGWTTIDADGDGYNWMLASEVMGTGYGYEGSNDCVLSQSYNNSVGVLYPDNYLVSPQVTLGGMMVFYACAQDASYAAEHFGVAVSTTSNTSASAFTMVNEWTMSAKDAPVVNKVKVDPSVEFKGMGHSRGGNSRAQGNWYQYTVDLSAFSGTGYVAIRHFNCSDMFYLDVDNILINEPGKAAPSSRSLAYYRIYRTSCYNDGPYTEENTVLLASEVVDTVYIDVDWPDAAPGVYKWGVGCVYAGNRGEEIAGPISWSQPVSINNTRDDLTYDFNDGTMQGWTTIDADNDGFDWEVAATADHQGNTYASVASASYDNVYGALTPNNYLVSPQVTLGGSINFWACAQDNAWASEHFGVAVSTTSNTDASAFTTIQEWTLTAKSVPTGKEAVRGNRDQGNWYEFTVDLSAFSGTGYVAIRHFDCTDWFRLNIDDITISTSGTGPTPPTPPTPGDNPNTIQEERESEIVWSNCLEKGMNLGEGMVDITVLLNSADSPEGTLVTFTNLNPSEQELYPIAPLTMDETGYYVFDSFRKGDYAIAVSHEGFEPVYDTVGIWDATSLRYVLIEIIYGVSDLYVSSTGWAMWGADGMPVGPGPGPGPGGSGSAFSESFENGLPAGWTTIDADGDGYNWERASVLMAGYNITAHSGEDMMCSQSYDGYVGPLTPDNYLVSEQVTFGSGATFSFWAAAQDASYAAEHFGVAISTGSQNNPADFTTIQEWTLTAKDGGMPSKVTRSGRAMGNYYQFTVNLNAYAGQTGYIAIRHFGCTDWFYIDVDDVELTSGAKDGDRQLQYYKVLCTSIDGEPIYNTDTEYPFCQLATDQLVEGHHYIAKVAAVYSTGMSGWTEQEWQYIPCENYEGSVNGIEVNGNVLSWEYPGGGTGPVPPQPGQGEWYYYDNGVYEDAIGAGGPFYWGVMFPAGSYEGNMVTKVAAYDYSPMSGTVTIYNDGATAPANSVGQANVTFTGTDDFVEFEFANPVVIDPTKNLWVVFYNATSADWPAACCTNTGNANGRWVSLDGVEWEDVASYGLNYTWMVRAYVAPGAKGEAKEITVDQPVCNRGTLTVSEGAKGNRAPWDLMMTFTAPEGGHYGVAYDGNNFYTSNWGYSSAAHNFYKYDLQGNMLEGFEIAGCGTLRGITYDGTYFYGVANSSTVYCVDLANHNVVSTFTSAYGAMRGITYDPVRDGFWVIGNWSGNLTLIDRTGAIVQVGPEPTSASDLAYYKDENDVEHVFCFNNGDNGVYDYNITTNTLGGSVFNFSNTPGYNEGSSGGCTVGSFNGKIAFIGDLQQSPNLIGVYELRDDNTTPTPPPTPSGDILGAMIFADGEWVAFVEAPTNTYTYEGDANVVCVRMVHNGTNTLPEGNIYFSMSCPECVDINHIPECEPGAPIHAEVLGETDQVKVWWGDLPAPPMEEWLYYDDGEIQSSVGAGGAIYWGIMFPASSLATYAGTSLTKVALMEYNVGGSYTLNVYVGGATAPGTLAATQSVSTTGLVDWKEIDLNTPVPIDGAQNVWITFYQAGIDYPATCCNNTGDANGRWVSVDGADWGDVASYGLNYTWMIRGFVTNQGKGGELVSLPEFKGEIGGELSSVAMEPKAPAFNFKNRASIMKYNVYRSDDNVTYSMIGEVAAVAGQTYYEYIDTPAAVGTYYYQVRAMYDNDCESEPAQAADDPTHNYVSAYVDAVGENSGDVVLYPNPTKGNVTIEAKGMNRITVVSVLGQVVYDTEVSEDQYILNMSQFNAGMYMVRVYTESGVTVNRVTVMQ